MRTSGVILIVAGLIVMVPAVGNAIVGAIVFAAGCTAVCLGEVGATLREIRDRLPAPRPAPTDAAESASRTGKAAGFGFSKRVT